MQNVETLGISSSTKEIKTQTPDLLALLSRNKIPIPIINNNNI